VSEIDRVIDLARRAHDGDAWHGPSLMATLDGVSPEQAAAHPVPGAHSIWEIVLHVAAWRGEVRKRLEGRMATLPDEGDWPAVPEPTAANWQAALERLRQSHEDLVGALRRFDAARLIENVDDDRDPALGVGVSYYVMLHGLVQHDLYHAGQIRLLARALTVDD
jgi:uncharacterized damage-inducible protein DinB